MATPQTDANRTNIRLIEEVTPGTTPATPLFELMRVNSATPMFGPVYTQSKELLADRNLPDTVLTAEQASFGFTWEGSFGTLDTILRFAMMSDWAYNPVRDNNGTAASNITAVSATQYTLTAPGTTQVNTGSFIAAQMIFASNFGVAGNNGLKVLTGGSGTTAVVAANAEATPPATARLKVVGFQGASGDITLTAGATNSINSTALDFTTMGLQIGEWVYLGGLTAGLQPAIAGNRDWVRILTVAAHVLTLDVTPAGWATDACAAKTLQVFTGDQISNSTTTRYYAVEVDYADLAVEAWDYINGNRADVFSTTLASNAIPQHSLSSQAMTLVNQTTRFAGATTKAAPANALMNTSSGLKEIRDNGTIIAGPNFPTSLSFQTTNSLRRQSGIGSLSSIGIGTGRSITTGTMAMYFGDQTIRNKVIAGTVSSLSAFMFDPTNAMAYQFDMPKVKYTSGDPSVTGIDTDRMLSVKVEALKAASGFTIQWSRYEGLPIS